MAPVSLEVEVASFFICTNAYCRIKFCDLALGLVNTVCQVLINCVLPIGYFGSWDALLP